MFMKCLCISSVGSEINLEHYWLRCLLAFHKHEDDLLLPQLIAFGMVNGHRVQQTAMLVSVNKIGKNHS